MIIKANISSKLDKFNAKFSFESSSDRIGILGESGAGKSLLLKFLAGIYNPDKGEIWLDDKCLYSTEKKINVKPQDRNIAYMFQNYALFPTMSVRQNIEIVVKGTREEKKEKADKLLKKFHIQELAGRKPGELSGGQQQRVALARVLAYEPAIILLDEPFSALDQGLKEILQLELENMLKDYAGKVIMVSHSMEELYKFSNELMVVSDGKIVEKGNKQELFHSPKTVKAARLIGINNILKVKPLEKNQIKLVNWDLSIEVLKRDVNNISSIGIRDEGFIPIWEKDYQGTNIIDIKVVDIYESMNQVKVFFNVSDGLEENSRYKFILDRKIYELKGIPSKLKIDLDKLIYFESNL